MDKEGIEIKYPSGHMTIIIPTALEEMPIANLKKVFRLLFQNYYELEDGEYVNINSAGILGGYIPQWILALQSQYDKARARRQAEYRDPEGISDKAEKRKAKAANKRLDEAVKKAKHIYDKSYKVSTVFIETRMKYI